MRSLAPTLIKPAIAVAVIASLVLGGAQAASAIGVPVATPVGQSVQVTARDGNASAALQYSWVTVAGSTTLSTSVSGPPPVGFTLYPDAPLYYNLTTTATHEDTTYVCIEHNDPTLNGYRYAQRLFQFVQGQWVASENSEPLRGCIKAKTLDGPFVLGQAIPGSVFPAFEYPNFPVGQYLAGPESAREVALLFTRVDSAGVTTMATSASGPAPSGFTLDPAALTYYNISTTATFTDVQVCVRTLGGSDDYPSQLNIYRYSNAQWTDVTSYQGLHNVCAQVSALGLFAVGQPDEGSTPVGTFQPVIPLGQSDARKSQITFSNVTSAGVTSLAASFTGPTPLGFLIYPNAASFFSVSTTAIISGPFRFCAPFTQVSGQNNAKIWEYSNGSWLQSPAPSFGGDYKTACGMIESTASVLAIGFKDPSDTFPGTGLQLMLSASLPGLDPENDQIYRYPSSLTFGSVFSRGTTAMSVSRTGPAPVGFSIDTVPEYYQLDTSATFDSVKVCIDAGQGYEPGGHPFPTENQLRTLHLYRYDSGGWTDVTSSQPADLVVCGTVSSLGTFAVGRSPDGVTPQASPSAAISLGTGPVASVILDSAGAAGITTHTISAIGPAPVGFSTFLSSAGYYRFSTTAPFTGNAGICINFDPTGNTGEEYTKSMFQYLNGTWVDITRTRSYALVCGVTSSIDGEVLLGNTPLNTTYPGTNIYASPADNNGDKPVTLGFPTVEGTGVTSVETTTSGPTPDGFSILGSPPLYYNVETTAAFSGRVSICITFVTSAMTNYEATHQHIYHYTNGAWVDITSGTSYGRACGETTSFSPFAVGLPISSPVAFTTTPIPTVSGTVDAGQTLSVTKGAWLPTPDSFDVQWLRDGRMIDGATSDNYQVLEADRGSRLSVTVTASKTGILPASVTSAQTSVVPPLLPLESMPTPSINGTSTVGSTLTAAPGQWAPAPVALSYQWIRNGTSIGGATASTYELVADDLGTSISVSVTGKRVGFIPATRSSATVVVVAGALTTTPVPSIVGIGQVGKTLTASAGPWAPSPVTLAFKWMSDGAPIAGATSATYVVTPSDLAHRLTVSVTGSKQGYSAVTKTSTPTARILPGLFSGVGVTVTGLAKVGVILAATVSTMTPSPSSVTYQWFRGGSLIKGANSAMYKVVAADVGSRLTIVVVPTSSGFLPGLAGSTPTAVVIR